MTGGLGLRAKYSRPKQGSRTELPNRKEVPGIRAVFFLALIIPLIAGASYFYNTEIAEEVIEEIEIVDQTTIPTTSTTTQSMLKLQKPLSCSLPCYTMNMLANEQEGKEKFTLLKQLWL